MKVSMKQAELTKVIKEAIVKLIQVAETILPQDVEKALRGARQQEESELAKLQLDNILENVELARELGRPICQDTGVFSLHIVAGDRFGSISFVREAILAGIEEATEAVPLRPNIVHPISRKSIGANIGFDVPAFSWTPAEGDFLEVTVLIRGGGCENVSRIEALRPTASVNDLKQVVIEAALSASVSCPPLVMGVGIGSTTSECLKLAERALLRPVGVTHRERMMAKLEKVLLKAVNQTGLGPMGLGGRTTALGVNVEYGHTHTATFPVGIEVSCWCLRRATCRIYRDGTTIVPL